MLTPCAIGSCNVVTAVGTATTSVEDPMATALTIVDDANSCVTLEITGTTTVVDVRAAVTAAGITSVVTPELIWLLVVVPISVLSATWLDDGMTEDDTDDVDKAALATGTDSAAADVSGTDGTDTLADAPTKALVTAEAT